MNRRRVCIGATTLVLAALVPVAGSEAASTPGTIERVSVSASGTERNHLPAGSTTGCSVEATNGVCTRRSVSDAGDRVVFSSQAANLVPGDTNNVADVFVWRRNPPAGEHAVISVTHGGNGASEFASISPNGAWVAFESKAANLPAGDGAPGLTDVFVYHLASGAMHQVSVPNQAGQVPDNKSVSPSVADNGAVAFGSFASNMVLPAGNAAFQQVYVNRKPAGGGRAELVSVTATGEPGHGPGKGGWISAAGDRIAFSSFAPLDSVEDQTTFEDDVYVRRLGTGVAAATTKRITADAGATLPSISPDGATVAFTAEASLSGGDGDGRLDIYTAPVSGGSPTLRSACSCSRVSDRPASVPAVADDGTVTFESGAAYLAGITVDQVWMGTGPTLVSVAGGESADEAAGRASISAGGGFVSFTSAAGNLVPGDYNGAEDVFLYDRAAGTLTRVSVGPGGVEASGFPVTPASPPGMSSDGRVVVFESASDNLVADDTNGLSDIFIRAGGTTSRVMAHAGVQPNGPSFGPAISGDGNLVVFTSVASNLVADGDTNQAADVYSYDRTTGEIRRISLPPYGEQVGVGAIRPSVSPNGAWIAFESGGIFDPVSISSRGVSGIFRHNVASGQTVLVTRSGERPQQANSRPSFDPSIADDGSVAFVSRARNMVLPAEADGTPQASADDIFVVRPDLSAVKASVANDGAGADDDSYEPAISADGNLVAFSSLAGNLVPSANADRDVFVRDLSAGLTRLVSVGVAGVVANGGSGAPAVNADGSLVAFTSEATNLVGADGNGIADVFLASVSSGSTARASEPAEGDANGPSSLPVLSADGLLVAFHSLASNLVPGDGNGVYDTFTRAMSVPAPTNGLPQLSVEDARAPEGGGFVEFRINLAGATSETVSARFRTSPGSATAPADFGAVDETVTFTSGNPLRTVRVPVAADSLDEPDETFTAVLTLLAGSAVVTDGIAVGTIADDDGTPGPGPDPDPGPGPDPDPGPGPGSGPGGDPGDDPGVGSGGSVDPGGQAPVGGNRVARSGYWMLGADGQVYPFGASVHHGEPSGVLGRHQAVDVEPSPAGNGYWVLDDAGRVHAYGDAVWHGNVDAGVLAAGERITSLSATPSGRGYWVFTSRGRVIPLGADARHFGDVSRVSLNGPVLDSVATPSGDGYYMVASDGGIFTFGDAAFVGSMGGTPLNAPVQSLVPDADGGGYWLVASDGGIFAFHADFAGSLGAVRLNRPITGMVRSGTGYLMVGEDGGIFTFSDRPFLGSLGDRPPARPIVAVAVLDR